MTHSTDLSAPAAGKKWQFLAVLITVAAFLLLSKLAWWQWQRAEEKTKQLQQIAQWQQQDGLPVAQLTAATLPTLDGAPLQGDVQWLAPFVWLVDNQIVNGVAGYDVLIPVQAQPDAVVFLLNLGWTAGSGDRTQLPQVDIPQQLRLEGILRTSPRPFILGQNIENTGHFPQRIQAIVPQQLSAASNLPLLDAVFYQKNTPLVSHYTPVILPPEKHRAYALQWALLAVAVVFVAFAVGQQRGKHD